MINDINDDKMSDVYIWSKMLFHDMKSIKLDVYYNYCGHPKKIHDAFGGNEVNKFRLALINEIMQRNLTEDIWRVHGDGFAIISKESNCDAFDFKYRDIVSKILKKTISLTELKN